MKNYYIRNIPPEEIRREIADCEREIWNLRRKGRNGLDLAVVYRMECRKIQKHIRKLEKYLKELDQ